MRRSLYNRKALCEKKYAAIHTDILQDKWTRKLTLYDRTTDGVPVAKVSITHRHTHQITVAAIDALSARQALWDILE